jgi:hypothetical protein
MSAEVKYDKGHHAGATPEARINNRLRNSGVGDCGATPDHVVQRGTGPGRTFTNIHESAGHGPVHHERDEHDGE